MYACLVVQKREVKLNREYYIQINVLFVVIEGYENMKYFITVLLLPVLFKGVDGLCETTALEPCLFKNNRELPYSVYTRHPSIDYSSATDDTKYCDLFALSHGVWYRSSYNMTNYCVDHRKCGTNDPIYLNGSIPSSEEGVVDRNACVRTFGNCCEHVLNLRIKNCEYFMIYCFMDLHPSCHSRFCFDVDLSVETTTTTTTTSSTTPSTTTTTTTTTTTPTLPPSTTVTTKETTTGGQDSPYDDIPCRGKYTNENKGTVVALAVLLVISVIALGVLGFVLYKTKRMPEAAYVTENPPPYEKYKISDNKDI